MLSTAADPQTRSRRHPGAANHLAAGCGRRRDPLATRRPRAPRELLPVRASAFRPRRARLLHRQARRPPPARAQPDQKPGAGHGHRGPSAAHRRDLGRRPHRRPTQQPRERPRRPRRHRHRRGRPRPAARSHAATRRHPRRTRAITGLCYDLTATQTRCPGTNLKLTTPSKRRSNDHTHVRRPEAAAPHRARRSNTRRSADSSGSPFRILACRR
jgi:hypothetical protein